MTVFGILFMWLIAVAGCIVMKKKSGHQKVPPDKKTSWGKRETV